MRPVFLWLSLLMVLAAAPAFAQDGLDRLISFNNPRDTEIRDIVMTLGRLGNVNVMVDPKVRGKMPLTLKDVSVADALRLVAGITGNKVGAINGVIIFATEETLRFMQGPGRNALYQLRYAKAEEVSGILNKVFAKDLTSTPHNPTNRLLVAPK